MNTSTRRKPTLKDRLLLGAGATSAIALGILGGGVAVDLAQPAVAQAYTDRSCHTVWKDQGWQTKCWRDYTWYEENCLWCWRGVDGWVYTPQLRW